jgi:NADPH-dependent curcumin reductase CurA
MTPINVGEVMGANAIAEVIESQTPDLPVGTVVVSRTNWSEYAVKNKSDCTPVKPVPGLSVTHFMGSLGLPGLTAYYALKEIAGVTAEDSVVISGAAGAVGTMAVQIAKKLLGCKYVRTTPSLSHQRVGSRLSLKFFGSGRWNCRF